MTRRSGAEAKPTKKARPGASASGGAQPSASQEDRWSRRLWATSGFLLGALLVWSVLSPQDSTGVFVGGALPQNLMGLGLALVTALAAGVSGRGFRFGRWAWLLVVACLGWLVLATVWAGRENNPRIAWNGFWQVVSLAAVYYSAVGLLMGQRARQALLWILLLVCVGVSFHGLQQVSFGFPADRQRYAADPEGILSSIGLDAPPGSPERQRFEDRLRSSEPYATFALANSLATLLSAGLLLLAAVGLQLLVGPSESPNRPIAWLSVWSICLLTVALCWFLTLSRSAYVAMPVAIAYAWLVGGQEWKRHRSLAIGSLLLGLAGATIGLVWLMRNDALVLSEAPKSLAYRLEYWIATARMIADHGLTGVGLGNFQSYYTQYKLPSASETVADPHNWLLDVFVNLSVPVGIVLLGWIVRRLFYLPIARGPAALPESVPTAATVDQLDGLVARSLMLGAILGGGLCGLGLSLLGGLNLAVVAVCWLAAGGLLSGLLPYLLRIGDGVMVSAARAASVAMLTCLLASGSWQASGLGLPLVLLLALGGSQQASPAGEPRRRQVLKDEFGLQKWWIALAASGLLIFLFQSWRPSTTSWARMQQALAANSPGEQLALAEAAAAADPLDSEPLRWLAQLSVQQATATTADAFPESAESALNRFDLWLSRDPTKAINWGLAGNNALELAAAARRRGLEDRGLIQRAMSYYEQAVNRYPKDVGLRAQLALALALGQQWDAAGREMRHAEQLSAGTVHLDKQLAAQLLWAPLLPTGAEDETFANSQPWIPAEPVAEWLRSHH